MGNTLWISDHLSEELSGVCGRRVRRRRGEWRGKFFFGGDQEFFGFCNAYRCVLRGKLSAGFVVSDESGVVGSDEIAMKLRRNDAWPDQMLTDRRE